MSINIKNEDAVAAVKELAAYYGLNYGAAIRAAATAVLSQPKPDDIEERIERARQIVAEYRRGRRSPMLTDDDIYGENGLYR